MTLWRVTWTDPEEGRCFAYAPNRTTAEATRRDLEAQASVDEEDINAVIERVAVPTDKAGLLGWLTHNADKTTCGSHTYRPQVAR